MKPSVNTKAAGEEIMALTGLRGAAALLVVLYHYIANSFASAPEFLNNGYIWVDLFFVLSGFVMGANYAKMFATRWTFSAYFKFLGRRIARIYPLYIFTVFIGLVLLFLKLNHPASAPLPIALISQIFLVQEWGISTSFDGPAWSISAEWAAYLLFPGLVYICVFQRWLVAFLVSLLSVAVIFGLYLFSLHTNLDSTFLHRPLNVWKPLAGLGVFRCIAEFSLGLVVYRIYKTPEGAAIASNRWLCGSVTVLIVALLCVRNLEVPLVLLFPVLVLCLTCKDQPVAKAFSTSLMEWLGKLSYSIYLFHRLVSIAFLEAIKTVMGHFGLRHQQIVATAFCILLTFVIAYLGYKYLEVPARRWLRNVFEPNRRGLSKVEGAIAIQESN